MGTTIQAAVLTSPTITLSEEDFPLVVELGNGALRVTVFRHDIATEKGLFHCWSYVTDGLHAFQQRPFEATPFEQRELVLTVAVAPETSPLELPTEPFGYLESLWSTAAEGGRLEEGGRVQGLSLLGSAAAILTLAWPQQGVQFKFGSFQVVPVTEEELEVILETGYARFLSVLGQVYRFYPYVPFWDSNRESVLTKESIKASILAQIPRCGVFGRVRMEQQQVTLRLLPENAARLAASLETLPLLAPFALLPYLDPQADACLSFRPNQPAPPFAITPPGTRSQRIAGCYHAFCPAEGTPEQVIVHEDGFAVLLEPDNLISARQALSAGLPWAYAGDEEGLTFVLEWGKCSQRWFDPAGVFREHEGYEAWVPHDIDPDYNKKPVRATLTVGLPLEAMQERIDRQAFESYCAAINTMVGDLLLPLAEGAAFDVQVIVHLSKDGTGEMGFAHRGEIKDLETLRAVCGEAQERLKQMAKPNVSDLVPFALTFQVGAGASEQHRNADA